MPNRKPRSGKKHVDKTGNIMHYLRSTKGLTIAALSAEIGISASILSRLERGMTSSILFFHKLAEYYGVDLDALARQKFDAVVASLTETAFIVDASTDPYSRAKARGNKGEKYVAESEKLALKDTPYAKGVNSNYAKDRHAHFDILSFTPEGENRYLEVKATAYGPHSAFFLSIEEYNFARQCLQNGKKYEIHRVFYINDPQRIHRVIITAEELFSRYKFEICCFRVTKEEH